ncbi:MAG: hypothetical protein Q7S14_00445 [bacterium]|nr:hypothetical protein [bacterium]
MQKLKWYQVQNKLQKLEKQIFTANDLVAIFGAKRSTAQAFLSYNLRSKKINRLKNGFYFFGSGFNNPFYVANILYTPSYISLETALSYHGIIPETVYSITSLTTKPSRNFGFENYDFIYQTVKKEAYTGYFLQNNCYMATAEKALADYCYFISLGKKTVNDRVDTSKINKTAFLNYLKLFKSKKIRKVTRNWLNI